jgi:hypothetical protein
VLAKIWNLSIYELTSGTHPCIAGLYLPKKRRIRKKKNKNKSIRVSLRGKKGNKKIHNIY